VASSDDSAPIHGTAGAVALLASSVGDPAGTRTLTAIVALLAVLGIGLVMIAVWLFRLTRPDKELLAPLEVMGERKWRRADPVWQRRRLDEVRPADASPLLPSAAPPDFDEAFEKGPTASGFDDLHDDAAAPVINGAAVKSEVLAEPVDADSSAEEAPDEAAAGQPAAEQPAAVSGNGDGASSANAPRPLVSPTPTGIERPLQLPDREIDPAILAAAVAELEAELGLRVDPPPRPPSD
jgi:hypothetical protein